MKKTAARYVLMDSEETQKLLYRETTGELAKCVKGSEVYSILARYHDSHGHFAVEMTLRMLKGRYYWPTRSKDVAQYINSCDSCQRFGPLHPVKRELKTLLNLQPMDMIGIDFMGPISPRTPNDNRYILLAVDYFSRYSFARPTRTADERTVVTFLRDIAKTMGWPTAIYCDNASYFVKGVVPEELQSRKILLFPAPVTHPSSVGLAEKYVHLTLTALRTMLAGGKWGNDTLAPVPLDRWDDCLDAVVFTINNRIVKTHGFSPAQLLFVFTPRGHPEDFTARDELVVCSGLLAEKAQQWASHRAVEVWVPGTDDGDVPMNEPELQHEREEEYSVWRHLDGLGEKRLEAVENTLKNQTVLEERFREKSEGKEPPEKGDLVLL